jgi:hypothetical protein
MALVRRVENTDVARERRRRHCEGQGPAQKRARRDNAMVASETAVQDVSPGHPRCFATRCPGVDQYGQKNGSAAPGRLYLVFDNLKAEGVRNVDIADAWIVRKGLEHVTTCDPILIR